MALRDIHSFGNVFDIVVNRVGVGKLGISIIKGQKVKKYVLKEGAATQIQL
jgi:hypothetical protein